jgi:hypothetical protein
MEVFMSGRVLGWAVKQKCNSSSAKAVLLILAEFANEDGICWPKVKLIAERAELSIRTVHTCLASLCELGLISMFRGKTRRSSTYQLNIPAEYRTTPKRRAEAGKAQHQHRMRAASTAADMQRPHILSTNPQSEPTMKGDAVGAPLRDCRAQQLAHAMGRKRYDTWLGETTIQDGPPAIVRFRRPFQLNRARDKYLHLIQRYYGEDVVLQLLPPIMISESEIDGPFPCKEGDGPQI